MTDLYATDLELRELLVDRLDVLSGRAFDEARAAAARLRLPLDQALAERARVPTAFLLAQLAESWHVPYSDLAVSDVQPDALRAIPEEFARTHRLAAFASGDGALSVATTNPRNAGLFAQLQRVTGARIVPVLAPFAAIQRAHLLYDPWLRDVLQRAGPGGAMPASRPGRDLPAPDLVDRLLRYAAITGASDVHIEPYELEGLVRYRIDGVLQEVFHLRPEEHVPVASRLKVLAGLRVDEKRAPQDGRFETKVGGVAMDLRVAVLPTLWGEKVVLRVLSKEPFAMDLEALGLRSADYQIVLERLLSPCGMVLVTGPTGSGKTTTLYAMLGRLAVERRAQLNISTIEDPVERPLARVSQVAVNPAAGIDFAGGLRSILRQDPDVIMVGEIRDRETAEIGARAALVGRLFFSTLHTNEAAGAIPRLLDIGVEPFMLASTLELVVTQRLARRICTACRETVPAGPDAFGAVRALPAFDGAVAGLRRQGILSSAGDPLAGVRLFVGRGCPACGGTGYRGRVGLFELLRITDPIKRLILGGRPSVDAIRAAAVEGGMRPMFEDGLAKVILGETTLDEAVRVTV